MIDTQIESLQKTNKKDRYKLILDELELINKVYEIMEQKSATAGTVTQTNA